MNKFYLKVGGTYVSRNDPETAYVEILKCLPSPNVGSPPYFPFIGQAFPSGERRSYRDSGAAGVLIETDLDLVAEYRGVKKIKRDFDFELMLAELAEEGMVNGE